jgi:hypothetical protein
LLNARYTKRRQSQINFIHGNNISLQMKLQQ